MEAIGETSLPSAPEQVKVNVCVDEIAAASAETDLCPKPNGVGNAVDVYSGSSAATERELLESIAADAQTADIGHQTTDLEAPTGPEHTTQDLHEADVMAALETSAAVDHLLGDSRMQKPLEELTEGITLESASYMTPLNEEVIEESIVEEDNEYKVISEKVTFETEVLVEQNDNDSSCNVNDTAVGENSNNILNEIGHNIELSEVLRSSDATDGAEHSNGAKQEVFNKEELLDILEGNDQTTDENYANDTSKDDFGVERSALEAEIALKQLSRLKRTRNTRQKRSIIKVISGKSQEKTTRRRKVDKKSGESEVDSSTASENCSVVENNDHVQAVTKEDQEKPEITEKQENHSIVNVLFKDWDDDEPSEIDESNNLLKEAETLINTSKQIVESQETVTNQVESSNNASTDCATVDSQTVLKKIRDEDQPQRRQGRVIKKKVPFDPDNPDTFTKSKNINKIKVKEILTTDKEQLLKKPKLDEPKSKSPVSKMAWKKPQPKNNSKQNRRLTEIDKLLMDEGAVNMIYQLTPEAPKGKKNMRTKAEFIKKIQSLTPDMKEMKFRERKVSKVEEEAKRILGGKRTSLSSSVKSAEVCEDFETHSADDSIIYRRHSSSSYSSSCMSPRRLSDVESSAAQSAARASRHASDLQNPAPTEADIADQITDIFMADDNNTSNEINKDDCLSIKEKLNIKLSQALKKRKRDSTKVEKPSKQKRISKEVKSEKNATETIMSAFDFKYLSVTFDQRLAEICIKKTGSKFSIEMLKELQKALQCIDNRKDISVTLISSECGTLCSEFNLWPLIDANVEKRTNYAFEIAESVRLAVCALEAHSKLVVAGVWGACAGAALALCARADVLLASESASFALAPPALVAGVAALADKFSGLPTSLVNEMVIFERRLTASEAHESGLVSRILWPERAAVQAQAIARDIASQPAQSVLLKKQLLSLNKSEGEATFLAALEKERDLLVQYWTSVEGQELLRATLTQTHT